MKRTIIPNAIQTLLTAAFFIAFCSPKAVSQITVNQATSTSQVEALVEDVLLGSCVTASNISYTGPASASGTFSASGTTFTMQNGILLTTGGANVAIGPNDEPDAQVNQGAGGDADLTSLAGETTYDAVVLEFDFVPQDDTLTFRYVFASEEYPEWVGSEYNDVFGFFVSGPGITGPYSSPGGFPNGAANIALIPGTTTPVAINNVNNGDDNNGPCENCAYYEENTNNDVQYDGYTTVLTAQVVVTPCQTYHIRLAVADAGDRIYDSGVFLEAGSFTSGGGITVDFSDVEVHEGCTDDYLVFRRVNLADNSQALGATYSIGGTATMGVDYDAFPLSVTIPAGEDSVVIPITVPLDYTVEGTETIIVNMDQPPCDCLAPGFATLNVIDNDVPLALTTTGETTICLGQSANLSASVSGSLLPYSGSWDNGTPAGENVTVSPTNTTTYTYTVTDACNSQTQTSSETITVIRPDFNANDESQCLDGNSFSFTNTGASGPTVSHFWDFGDGNNSTDENPSHSYLADGDYTVTHYVIFLASNCTASASALMTVYPEPTVSVSVDTDVICAGGTDGALSASVTGGTPGYGYVWSSGGASTASISGVGVGTYTVTVTDANGCTDTGSGTVNQVDPVNPTITCPPTANISTDAGLCTSSASIGTPTTDDNCGVASVVVDNPGPYSVGTTTVTWTVTDDNGNTATCSQDVVVTDDEDPTILGCPNDIDITPTSSTCSPEVIWNIPQADDNCSATLSSNYNSGDSFQVGTTTVTYTATDASGNTFSCSFDVTITPSVLVLSIDPSTVICGANITCNGATDGTATANVSGGCLPYTYLWSNGQTTQTATGLGAGSYTVTVTDANGSSESESITLTEPDALEIDGYELSEYVGGSGVSCNGASDGDIDISVVGGSTCEPYDITWTGPNGFTASSQNLTGLEAGSYTVTILDINGCSTSATYTITEPTTLVATCSAEDALCNGDANGSVSVSVTGGTEPYSYSWSNGSTDASQSGLTAGTYVVTVTDANGCTATCNATVGQPNILTAVVVVQDETLVNGCNGSATVNPTGGTPPYSYEWSNGGTTQTITDLCAGTYTVTVYDANMCEYTTSNIVNPPSCDLDVAISSSDVDCNGSETGTATATPITVQNNTPFTYLWNNGATTQTLSGVSAGPYSVVVTDSIGCEASGSVVISEPSSLSVSTSVTDEQTFEGCDGSATATASGGTPPYSYQWSDGQTTATASNLCPGTYTVTVTDANGCEETVTITVNPLLCTGFSVAINTESLSCFEAGDGSATAVVTGGTAPFTYSWSNGGTTATISGLAAGSYTVTVTDAVNCSQTVSGNVSQPALLEAATAVDNVSCHGTGNGVVELTVTGGTPDYTFAWDNGATTEDLNNVGPGSYNVLVTDENGCTVTASAVVTEPDTLQVSSVDVDPTCFEGNDGSIDLTVSGGLGPYLVAWDSGQNTADISGLSAGTYTATVVDQNGCIYTYSTTLTEPPLVVPTITADGPTIFCEGDSVTLTSSEASSYLWSPNGETTQSITVYDAGDYSVSVVTEDGCEGNSASTTVSIFQVDPATITADGPTEFCDGSSVILTASQGSSYLWMPNGETTQSITVTEVGIYSVTVTDANGCESSSDDIEITVFDLPEPIVTADGPLTFCDGGSVTLTSSESASYSWAPFGQTTQSIVVTESGIYRVTITNEDGCQSTSDPIQVIVNDNPEPVITADGPTEFCEGGSVDLLGPNGYAIYSWSPNGENTQSITASESGDYQLTVTDENGCVGESNIITVTEFDVDPAAITAQGDTEFCEGGEVILVSSPGASYEWSPNGETSQTINVSESGTYTVTVTDENGCVSTSDPVDVIVNPLPDATVTLSGPTEFCEGDSVTLTAPAGYVYQWSPNGETTQSITVYVSGTYTVSVTNENECLAVSDPITITVFEEEEVEITADGATEFCDGDQVVLTASTGTAWIWSPNGETTQSITVAASGIYTVSITDANGCSYASSDSVIVTVNPLPQPTVTADGPTEFCQEGSVVLTSSAAESYFWAPNGETTQSITITDPGIYRVTVTDENGCQGTSDPVIITVFDLPEPEITANGALTICPEDSVTLTSSAASSYTWSPNGETTQSITVSTAGTYSVTVVDQNGCEGESEAVVVEVFEVEPATVTASGITEFCEGDDVTLTASGGSAYEWSPSGENTPSITVSETGTYSVIVTDQNGCDSYSDSIDVTVFELPEPIITTSAPTEFCEGDSVTLTVTAGEAYLWEPNGETTQSITVYESGSYSVQIADANTCVGTSDTIDVVVFVPEPAEIGTSGPSAFCDGGEVELTAIGGSSWEWSNNANTQSIIVTTSGEYSVEITDENGCSSMSDTISVEVFELPTVAVTASELEICEGDSSLLTALSNDEVNYEWFNNGSTINGATDSTLFVLDDASYSVLVTDTNGCTATDDAPTVSVGLAPVAEITGGNIACPGDTIVLMASGGENYLWSTGETTSSIAVLADSVGIYTVTVSNAVCSQTSSDSAEINVFDTPDALIETNSAGFLEVEHLFNEISGDSSIVYWTWDFGDGLFEEGQSVNNYYSDEGFFTVVVTTENEDGCLGTDTAIVEITQVIDIPNVFTPNDDGYNDHLFIGNFGVENYELTIYNRWGIVMHHDDTGEIFWDGKTPAGVDAEAGAYFYILDVINPDHSEGSFKKTGYITLIR